MTADPARRLVDTNVLVHAYVAATMIEHGITTVVTENERDFKKVPGLTITNPFK